MRIFLHRISCTDNKIQTMANITAKNYQNDKFNIHFMITGMTGTALVL